jgi:hypothetical protein
LLGVRIRVILMVLIALLSTYLCPDIW